MSDDIPNLESLIREAGDFIEPSRNLRPRVIEATRDNADQRRLRSASGLSLLVGLAASIMIVVITASIRYVDTPRGVTSEQVHDRAYLRSRSTGVSLDWALSEVFEELHLQRPKR